MLLRSSSGRLVIMDLLCVLSDTHLDNVGLYLRLHLEGIPVDVIGTHINQFNSVQDTKIEKQNSLEKLSSFLNILQLKLMLVV